MADTYDPQWFTQEVTNCIETENQRYVEMISYNHMVHHPEVKFIKIEKIREETRVGVRLTRIMFIAIRGAAFQVKMYKIAGLIPRSTLAIEGGQDFGIQRRQFRKRKRETGSRYNEKDGEEIAECKRMRLKTDEEDSVALGNENNNEKTNRSKEDARGDVEDDDCDEGGEDNCDEKLVNDDHNDHFDLRKFLTSFINYDHYDNGGDNDDDESDEDDDDDDDFDLKKLLTRYYKEEQYDADDDADDDDDNAADDDEEDEKDVRENDDEDGDDNDEEDDGYEKLVSDDDDERFDLRKLFEDDDDDSDHDEEEKVVTEDVDEDDNGEKDNDGENKNEGGNKVTEESDDDDDEAGGERCDNVEGDGDSDVS